MARSAFSRIFVAGDGRILLVNLKVDDVGITAVNI